MMFDTLDVLVNSTRWFSIANNTKRSMLCARILNDGQYYKTEDLQSERFWRQRTKGSFCNMSVVGSCVLLVLGGQERTLAIDGVELGEVER